MLLLKDSVEHVVVLLEVLSLDCQGSELDQMLLDELVSAKVGSKLARKDEIDNDVLVLLEKCGTPLYRAPTRILI